MDNMVESTEENPYHSILQAFGISPLHFTVIPHETSLGLINTTYFVIHTGNTNDGAMGNDDTPSLDESNSGTKDTSSSARTDIATIPTYVMQLFNHNVFDPNIVEANIFACTAKLQASPPPTAAALATATAASVSSSSAAIATAPTAPAPATAELSSSSPSSCSSSSHTRTHVKYLSYLTTTNNRHFHIDEDGRYYRIMQYIPGYYIA